ncbi:MAG: alpha/beta hydrolase [bacterium]
MSTFYKTWGSGQRVYLGIHGWGGGWQTFEPLLPYLPANVTLHAVDLPGYGSTSAPQAWTLDAMADAVCEVIDRVQGDITLVGNCSGAIFGMLGVLKRPQRFERLVLIDPFAYFPWYFRIMTIPALGRLFYASAFQNPLGRIATNLSLANHRTDESDLTQSFEALNHDAVFAHLQLLDAVGDYHRFEPITTPIDLVNGEKTFDAIRRSATLWQGIWPQARVHVLAGAAHLPLEEAPSDLAKIVFRPKKRRVG